MKSILNRINVDTTKQPLFLGEGLSLQRYDRFRYEIFFKLFRKQIELIWTPEEISLDRDRADFQTLTDNEKFIFTSNLKFQTMLDSVVSRGVPTLLQYVSNPELEACLNVWQMFETLHSYSYTYIIKNVYPDPGRVLDSTLEDEEILKRAETVCRDYDLLASSKGDVKSQIYLTLISINILEAIRFYVSFVCAFAFAENKKMIGNADIVKLIRRDECVTPDTELLTPDGWKPICEISYADKVAQYEKDGSITFVKPMVLSKHYIDHVYNFKNKLGHIDLSVSENHRVISRKVENDALFEKPANKFSCNVFLKIPMAGIKEGGSKKSLTPHERFLIAFQADGTLPKGEYRNGNLCGYRRVCLYFKKKRKIKRLREILKECGYEYDETPEKDGLRFNVNISISLNLSKTFDWVDLSDVSYEWCQQFIDELSYWDGHRVKESNEQRITYGSVIKLNCDVVQAIAVLADYRTQYRCIPDERSETYSDYHRLQICRTTNFLSAQCVVKRKVSYDGYVYGIQVPSGMIVVRRNGGVCITGNSQHVAITQNIIKCLREQPDEGFQETIRANESKALSMFEEAVAEEKAWATYLFANGSMLGLNEQILHQYIEWLADTRLVALGLPRVYNAKRNPIKGWSDAWFDSEKVQVAPQEHEITSYKISASENDIGKMDLTGFKL